MSRRLRLDHPSDAEMSKSQLYHGATEENRDMIVAAGERRVSVGRRRVDAAPSRTRYPGLEQHHRGLRRTPDPTCFSPSYCPNEHDHPYWRGGRTWMARPALPGEAVARMRRLAAPVRSQAFERPPGRPAALGSSAAAVSGASPPGAQATVSNRPRPGPCPWPGSGLSREMVPRSGTRPRGRRIG